MITKFVTTGVINTIIDFLILNVLIFTFGLGFSHAYILFKAVAFIGAVTNSYFMNRYWVFEANDKPNPSEGALFFCISIIGLIINTVAATLTLVLFKSLNLNIIYLANLGALVGTLAVLIWNFLGYKYIVFTKKDA